MTRIVWILALLVAGPAAAQDGPESFRIGNDAFLAGTSVEVRDEGLDDVFAAGERVDLSAPIGGSAHLAGRRVNSDAAIGGDLYAAGADVTLRAPIAGAATLAGYDVNVLAPIETNLRAGAANLKLMAPVGGTALVAARSVEINSTIAGDAAITAGHLEFGPDARIGGRLRLYGEDVSDLAVPDRVMPADRIERFDIARRAEFRTGGRVPGVIAIVSGFVLGVLLTAILATLAALLAPENLERTRNMTRERPLRTFWIGFLALAALIGASILLLVTLIGVLVAPAVLILAVGLGFLGYLVATYLVGRALWGWFGALPPDTLVERALAALIGAVAVGLIALIPFLGWLALFVLSLTGVGALTVAIFRPELRTT